MSKNKEKLYKVTMTESQLKLMADAVEDWHRFLAGQCELQHATQLVEDMHEAQRTLNTFVRPYIVPKLKHYGASYGWSGGNCPNEHQRKAIAMSYGIYREVLHYFATHAEKPQEWNVYNSETLTCPEQGGRLITIEEVEE